MTLPYTLNFEYISLMVSIIIIPRSLTLQTLSVLIFSVSTKNKNIKPYIWNKWDRLINKFTNVQWTKTIMTKMKSTNNKKEYNCVQKFKSLKSCLIYANVFSMDAILWSHYKSMSCINNINRNKFSLLFVKFQTIYWKNCFT